MGDTPQKSFHGKVLVRRGDTEIHVNIFDDDKNVVYQQIQYAIAQFSGDIGPAMDATRELHKAAQARQTTAFNPQPKATTTATRTKAANAPVCEECSQADMVELISWADKQTGEKKKAWKCQRCKKWLDVRPK